MEEDVKVQAYGRRRSVQQAKANNEGGWERLGVLTSEKCKVE
jgi:hypothetical protein